MKKILLYVLVMLFLTAGMAVADDEESWITIGGDLRVRYDNLKGTVHDYISDDGAAILKPNLGMMFGITPCF